MEKLQSILNYSVGSFTVGKIFEAVIVFVICYFLIRIIMKVLKRVLGKTSLDATLSKIITAVIKFILCFITAIIVIDTLGVSATSLVAAFSVVGLAASLAVQDSLSNLASGIMILVAKPFKIGDYVEADGVTGTVMMTGLIPRTIKAIDNKVIYVPNSKIIAAKIVNYTSQEKRRVDIEISASYDAPIEKVRKALLDAVENTDMFLDDPEKPFAAVLSYDDSSIKYVVRAWVETPKYWDAHFALMERIKTEFDNAGIEMTYNHLNVHLIDKSEGVKNV